MQPIFGINNYVLLTIQQSSRCLLKICIVRGGHHRKVANSGVLWFTVFRRDQEAIELARDFCTGSISGISA